MTESQQRIIEETATFVQLELQGAEAGHDWFHIQRVWKNARNLLQSEPADPFIVQLGALLHDIADAKFHDGNEDIGPAKTRAYLESHNIGEEVIDHVVNIVRHISFKGGHSVKSFHSAELSVVQDADRLDALGAIGIARAFHFGGFKTGRYTTRANHLYCTWIPKRIEKHRPDHQPFLRKTVTPERQDEYPTGKSLAEERHLFMESFLQQFYHEWEGQNKYR